MFLKGATADGADKSAFVAKHLDTQEFHDKFYSSELGIAILEKLNGPARGEEDDIFAQLASVKFANPWHKSLKLLVDRELTLWWRNKVRKTASIKKWQASAPYTHIAYCSTH